MIQASRCKNTPSSPAFQPSDWVARQLSNRPLSSRRPLGGEVGTELGGVRVLGIDHIEWIVRDVDEFVEFYQKLGFEVLLRTVQHGWSAELKLPCDNQPVLEIHSATGEESIGINHIAFKVANALEAYDDVVSKGIKPDCGPHLVEITGRTNVNMKDPYGWHLQMADAGSIAPQ